MKMRRGNQSPTFRAEAIETPFFLQDRFIRLTRRKGQSIPTPSPSDRTETPEKDAPRPFLWMLKAILNFKTKPELGSRVRVNPAKIAVFFPFDVSD